MSSVGLDGLDPSIVWTLRIFLAAVFGRALLAKLRAPREFLAALRAYELLPSLLSAPIAALLLGVELAIIVGLLFAPAASATCMVAAGLLLLYAGAIGINLARGRRDIDCGCAGRREQQPLHELLVARNLCYSAMALLASSTPALRSWIWLDVATIALALAALALLGVALDGIAALAALQRRGAGA